MNNNYYHRFSANPPSFYFSSPQPITYPPHPIIPMHDHSHIQSVFNQFSEEWKLYYNSNHREYYSPSGEREWSKNYSIIPYQQESPPYQQESPPSIFLEKRNILKKYPEIGEIFPQYKGNHSRLSRNSTAKEKELKKEYFSQLEEAFINLTHLCEQIVQDNSSYFSRLTDDKGVEFETSSFLQDKEYSLKKSALFIENIIDNSIEKIKKLAFQKIENATLQEGGFLNAHAHSNDNDHSHMIFSEQREFIREKVKKNRKRKRENESSIIFLEKKEVLQKYHRLDDEFHQKVNLQKIDKIIYEKRKAETDKEIKEDYFFRLENYFMNLTQYFEQVFKENKECFPDIREEQLPLIECVVNEFSFLQGKVYSLKKGELFIRDLLEQAVKRIKKLHKESQNSAKNDLLPELETSPLLREEGQQNAVDSLNYEPESLLTYDPQCLFLPDGY